MTPMDSARLPLEDLRFKVPSLPPHGKAVGGKIDKNSKLYQACEDFQAVFIKQMLDVMKKTIDRSDLVEHGMGEDVFEDMLYDEYSKTMSKTAGFDLADNLYKQMDYLQNLPKAAK